MKQQILDALLDSYFSEKELAAQINKSVRTLQRWRDKKTGPPWTAIGETIFYSKKRAFDWIKSQERGA
jgi:hypothetical protein